MATKDLWQFRSVQDYGDLTYKVYGLADNAEVTLDSYPYPEAHRISDGFGGFISPTPKDLVISFGMAEDIDRHVLTGRVRLIFSTLEFPRDAEAFDDTRSSYPDVEIDLDLAARGGSPYKILVNGVAETIIYASLFYYTQENIWITNPSTLMDRHLTRSKSDFGQVMYDLLPRYYRKADADHDFTTRRVLELFGIALDDFQALQNHLKRSTYDVGSVDAGKIPYIDQLLGWPTNFELPEGLRRNETTQVVSLWRNKSSARALELVMQNTIGWNVEIYEGMDTVFRLNYVAPENPPADWIEGEADPESELPADQQPCGVWNDVQRSYTATWADNSSSPIRSTDNLNMILPSNEGWQNTNGVLIRLLPGARSKTLLSELALKKAKNIVPLFLPHYAQVFFTLTDLFVESLKLGFTSEFDDEFIQLPPIEDYRLDIGVESGKYKSGLCLFSTYPIPTEMNNTRYRLHHVEIEFTCEP